jgi:SecD/SecF fusion protein
VLTDEQLIQDLRTALERESAEIVPPPGLLASIRDELRSSPAPKRRWWRGWSRGPRPRLVRLAPLAALLVVVAVVAVFLGVQSRKPGAAAGTHGGFTLVYRAEPTAQTPVVNRAAVARAVSVMRGRVAELAPGGAASVTVTSAGTKIFVHVGARTQNAKRLEQLVGTTARLEFYDWEANALTSSGKTVASQLPAQNPEALEISQGGSAGAPGSPGAGSMPLYQAVQLASKQPYEASRDNARFGPEYFAFGAPGSTACATAAAYYHIFLLDPHSHCYLAGPQGNTSDLNAALPPRVSASEAQVLTVKRGTVVLQATPASSAHPPQWNSPTAQFFALRDHVSLFGNDITNAHETIDPSGSPDVAFGFTPKGATAFQNVTAAIAHRGSTVSGFGQTLNQHFAVALDTQLITVPEIDFKAYPNGITGANGGDITGGFTIQSARDLATQLRLGALPINLKLIAVTPR